MEELVQDTHVSILRKKRPNPNCRSYVYPFCMGHLSLYAQKETRTNDSSCPVQDEREGSQILYIVEIIYCVQEMSS